MSTDILIVEDHPTMRAAMRAVLEQEGYVLREAPDGPAALAHIAERAPDVMFLDLHMPGMTGEEVLAAVKQNPDTAGVKIVIVTAQGEEGRRKVLELGADAYFQKPYSPLGLLQAVGDVMSGGGEAAASIAIDDEPAQPEAIPAEPGEAEPSVGYDPLWPGER